MVSVTYTTSPSLLLRIRDPNNTDAWNEFVEIYSPIVRRYSLQRGLQTSDVEDITQDVMATVATSIRKFDYDPRRGKFRSWLGTVTANRIKTLLARNSRRKGKLQPVQAPEPADDRYRDPDSEWVTIFSERIFRIACERIRAISSETAWQCFESTWIHNLSPQEVAGRLEIAVHAVYVNKSRVLKRLEKEVQHLAEDLPMMDGINCELN